MGWGSLTHCISKEQKKGGYYILITWRIALLYRKVILEIYFRHISTFTWNTSLEKKTLYL